MVCYHRLIQRFFVYYVSRKKCIKLFRVRLSLIYDSNDLDSLDRGRGKKGFIGIPTIALGALLAKLKLDPTLYVYEMANYWHQSGFGAYTISQIWQGLNSRNISRTVLEIHAKEQNEVFGLNSHKELKLPSREWCDDHASPCSSV
jgi:hypothetical protein